MKLETDTLVRQKNEETIIAWLQQNAIPLNHVEAGNGFVDLQPLKQILRDVQIVGLGEATHGTRELFQLKHRLLEFLVKEMGFNAFALEASYAACHPINNYILSGKGDRATVLSGQGYVVWDTEEFSEMLDWLRAYNQSVPDKERVRFYGLDLLRFNDLCMRETLAYLRKVAPGRVPVAESLLETLALAEEETSIEAQQRTEHVLPQLQELLSYFNENRNKFVENSSISEFDNALQYIQVIKQSLLQESNSARSRYMAENLLYLVDHERPDVRFVLWAHNVHVGKGRENRSPGGSSPGSYMGYYLREKYGEQYYAFGFEFFQGSYQSRVFPPGEAPADLKEVTLPQAPKGSLAWYLSRVKPGQMLLDLRETPDNPGVEHWLNTPQVVHHIGWAYQSPSEVYAEVNVKEQYDGIIFIDSTTATRPTVNALKTVVNRKGL